MGKLLPPAQLHASLCAAALFLGATDAKVPAGRRQIKGFGLRSWPASRLYKEFGLVAIPQYAQYRRTPMP